MSFAERYGPWALVAGASQGIGAAFARHIAMRGINVALVARHAEPLEALAKELHTVEALPIVADLSQPAALADIQTALAEREINLLVCNAAYAPTGPFLELALSRHERVIDVNVRAPLALAHTFGGRMAERHRGGIILMSSIAGLQGAPYLANYAATKAYNLILAEGLWAEFAQLGVDVLASCPGPTASPGYNSTAPARRSFPVPLSPDAVACDALDALGHGPSHVPGLTYRVLSQMMRRVLPRTLAIRLLGQNTKHLSRSAAG